MLFFKKRQTQETDGFLLLQEIDELKDRSSANTMDSCHHSSVNYKIGVANDFLLIDIQRTWRLIFSFLFSDRFQDMSLEERIAGQPSVNHKFEASFRIVCKVRTQDPENFHEEVKSLATAW